jgi:alkanesulfonate monooxygenase SsuD/methylene tetrahydromethanopterin reductase-like flavin-dependent oxidoreductase (luciferase family)
MLRIGFGYVILSIDPVTAIEQSVQAEKSGFDTVWVPDHFVDIDGDRLEPWTVLSAVGMRTKKIRLGSGVTDTQRNHPARTAHAVACLDVISSGRAILGIGAGEAMNIIPYGLPWDAPTHRVKRLEETIRVIQLLWSSSRHQPVNFKGSYFQLQDAFLSQQPVQKPHPPIFVGAFSSRNALRVVGRLGDGWYAWLNTPDTFRERWRVISQEAEAVGRSVEKIEPASHIMIAFPRNSKERRQAIESAKAGLVMERTVLAQFGRKSPIASYQRLGVLPSDLAEIVNAASQVPDDVVEQTMAIGDIGEVEDKIDSLSNAGVRHFAIGDLLAPKNIRRTMRLLRRLIKHYE